jgi:hypothetical protein
MPSFPDYDDWIGQNLLSDNNPARSDTNIVYNRVKHETAVAVGGERPGSKANRT